MKESKTVLITGASSGIGAAIASMLTNNGYRVYGTTRHLANLEKSTGELRAAMDGAGGASEFPLRMVELDVRDDDSVRKCVDLVLSEAGRIDVLINNAGYGTFGPVEELPIERAQALFDTMVFGPLRMIQAVVPGMRSRHAGMVINISSIAARAVIPFQAHYSAVKAALESLTIGLRQELRPFGVRVTALEPSDIDTRFNDVTVFGNQEQSPYRPWSEPCWKVIAANLPNSPPPSVVAQKVLRIIGRGRPAPIHTCGLFLQRLAPNLFRILPKRAEMFAMRVFYGLPRNPR